MPAADAKPSTKRNASAMSRPRAAHLIGYGVARRNHEDGHVRRFANTPAPVEPVVSRQVHIEQNQGRIQRCDLNVHIVERIDRAAGVSIAFEQIDDLLRKGGTVFDDEDGLHGMPFVRSRLVDSPRSARIDQASRRLDPRASMTSEME